MSEISFENNSFEITKIDVTLSFTENEIQPIRYTHENIKNYLGEDRLIINSGVPMDFKNISETDIPFVENAKDCYEIEGNFFLNGMTRYENLSNNELKVQLKRVNDIVCETIP